MLSDEENVKQKFPDAFVEKVGDDYRICRNNGDPLTAPHSTIDIAWFYAKRKVEQNEV